MRAGKLCIEVAPTSKTAWISEELCIGCGICVKVRCWQDHLCSVRATGVQGLNGVVRAEMPVRRHHDHQPAEEPGEGDHAPIWSQFLQAAQARQLYQFADHGLAYLHPTALTCALLPAGYQCPGQRRC